MVGTRQYEDLSKYYDLLYSWKDYAKESRVLFDLIARYKKSPGNSLLDVGCGTGQHIRHLKDKYECVGMDMSKGMLAQARHNVKGVEFVKGDMVEFDLGRKFDVIVCLFSAIGYVRTYRRLARTLVNFAEHLRPGGLVIIEPWFTKSAWNVGHVHVLAQGTEDLKVVRVDHAGIKGSLSILDARIIVAEKGKGITTYRDRMTMGLFEKSEFLKLIQKAGLRGRYLKRSLAPGRGLYVCTKERA